MAIDFPNSPTTGQTYTASGNTWRYDGEKWILIATASSPDTGLVRIASGTFSGTTPQLNSVFSSTFDNYRLVLSNVQHASADEFFLTVNLLSGTTPANTNYAYSLYGYRHAGTLNTNTNANQIFIAVGTVNNSTDSGFAIDIYRPNIADNTKFTGQASSYDAAYSVGGRHSVATAYDGIQLSTFRLGGSSTTLTGSYFLYGYRH